MHRVALLSEELLMLGTNISCKIKKYLLATEILFLYSNQTCLCFSNLRFSTVVIKRSSIDYSIYSMSSNCIYALSVMLFWSLDHAPYILLRRVHFAKIGNICIKMLSRWCSVCQMIERFLVDRPRVGPNAWRSYVKLDRGDTKVSVKEKWINCLQTLDRGTRPSSCISKVDQPYPWTHICPLFGLHTTNTILH